MQAQGDVSGSIALDVPTRHRYIPAFHVSSRQRLAINYRNVGREDQLSSDRNDRPTTGGIFKHPLHTQTQTQSTTNCSRCRQLVGIE